MELLRNGVMPLRFDARRRGFTMVEMMVVLSIFATLVAIGTPVYATYQKNLTLQNTVEEVLGQLRVAEEHAISAQDGMYHGVQFTSDTYTLFNADRSVMTARTLPNNVRILSGDAEVVFERLTGFSDVHDIVVGYAGGDQRHIHVTKTGSISVN